MHPELFHLGPFVIRFYGVLLAISFILGTLWSIQRAKKQGIKSKLVMDLTIVIFISSLLGARFFYVIFHLEEFKENWIDVISPIQSSGDLGIGGLSLLGGVLLAIVSGIFFLRIKQESVWKFADVITPAFPLGIVITRIGCFLNGCCFGKPHEGSLGIVFPDNCPAGYTFPGLPLYPTQLFSSLKGLSVLAILLLLERYKKFDGFTFWVMVILFAIGRIIIDFYRYYESSMVLATIGNVSISVNQGVLVGLIIVAIFMLFYLKHRASRLG
ncbi:MAG: prolipoprotein diacylglyceryl transferase [candidate division Zixibacteria bacterium]|nr:prolipoprotein diacylglyceryl transferase [candidate division Zixibacteria bacterium]